MQWRSFAPATTTEEESPMHLRAAGAALALLAIAAPAAHAAVPPISFAPTAYYPTGQQLDSPSADDTGTAVGDFNGDGKPDHGQRRRQLRRPRLRSG
jgi:hypothetical protein